MLRSWRQTTTRTSFSCDFRWVIPTDIQVRFHHTDRSAQSKSYILPAKPRVGVQVLSSTDTRFSVDLVNLFHEPMINPWAVTAVNKAMRAAASGIAVPLSASQPLLCTSRFKKDVDVSAITAFLKQRLGRHLRDATYRQKLRAKFLLDQNAEAHDGEMEVWTGDTLFDVEGSHVKIPGRCLKGSFLTRKDRDGGIVISLGVESVASIAQSTSVDFCQLFKGLVTRPIVGVPRPLSPAGEQGIKCAADLLAGVFTPCGMVNLVLPEGVGGPLYVALRGTVFPSACAEVVVVGPDGSETMYRSAFLTPYRNPMALGLRNLFGLQTCWDNTVIFRGSSREAVPQEVPEELKIKYENVLPVPYLTQSLIDVGAELVPVVV